MKGFEKAILNTVIKFTSIVANRIFLGANLGQIRVILQRPQARQLLDDSYSAKAQLGNEPLSLGFDGAPR